MPKNFQQVTAFPSEDVKIASMRITTQRLLNLQSKTVHPTPHVCRARRQPDSAHQLVAQSSAQCRHHATQCHQADILPNGDCRSIRQPDLNFVRTTSLGQ